MAIKNPDRVCVLYTNIHPLVIRANPSQQSVRGFVKEHMRRYREGEPSGRQGLPAYCILGAAYFDSEADIEDESKGTPFDISKLLQV